jgi:hypothetical protein
VMIVGMYDWRGGVINDDCWCGQLMMGVIRYD